MMKLKFADIWAVKHFFIAWFAPLVLAPILAFNTSEAKCAYVVLIMITYWFTEVLPLAITSLVPVVLFPLLEIVPSDEIAKSYFNGTIMVFFGSLVAATAVEKSNLHERIALKVILITGTSPKRLFMGFMFTTAFLSMWISNLASVALMIPIINAALDQLTRRYSISYQGTTYNTDVKINVDNKRKNSMNRRYSITTAVLKKKASRKLKRGIMLGICYAANIGGTGTLTGTSTNLVLNGFLKEDAISFADWFFFNIPGLILLLIFNWLFLTLFYIHDRKGKSETSKHNSTQVYEMIKIRYEQLGKLSFHEFAVLILFLLLLSLWFFRCPDFMPGWIRLFNDDPHFIKDSVPTIFVVLLFFMIPANPKNMRSSPMLLDWKTTQDRVSWSVILLLGGGFAMASGCEKSGLSYLIGDSLHVMSELPHSLITVIVCLFSMFLTEFMTNTAAVTILLPVIKEMTTVLHMNPLSVMLPVTVSCSYAFMLPIASGTNAIIFEASNMRTKDMLIPGFFLKIFCLAVLLIMTNTWGGIVFDMSPPVVANVTHV